MMTVYGILLNAIENNRKHRKEIIEMIKALPKEFINEIRESIAEANESEVLGEICEDKCRITYLDDGTYYSYSIVHNDELILCKGQLIDDHHYDKFELNLEYNDYEELPNYFTEWIGDSTAYSSEEVVEETDENGNKKWIASFMDCTEDEYNVVKTHIGNIVYFNRENPDTERNTFHFGIVPRRSIPKDLNISDLDKLNKGMTLRKRKEQ